MKVIGQHLRRIRNVASGEMPVSDLSATKMLLTPDELETRLNAHSGGEAGETLADVTAANPAAPPAPRTPGATPQPGPATPSAPVLPTAIASPQSPAPVEVPAPPEIESPSRMWVYLTAAVLSLIIVAAVAWQIFKPGSAEIVPQPKGPDAKALPVSIDTSTGDYGVGGGRAIRIWGAKRASDAAPVLHRRDRSEQSRLHGLLRGARQTASAWP
ncbi:MAG: hypothetical protein U5J83_01055 [Bryobacterales bacterium]|nr:hypothetical protein [Bryobacterales bacterium]